MSEGKSGLTGAEKADIDVVDNMVVGERRTTCGGEEPLRGPSHDADGYATRQLTCMKAHSINHIHHDDGIATMCIGHEFTKSKAGSEYFTRTRTKTKTKTSQTGWHRTRKIIVRVQTEGNQLSILYE